MKKIILLLLCLLLLNISSCIQDQTTITDNYLIGSVKLYDDGQTPADNSGMIVTVQGTEPEISGITDVDGKFSLKNVPKGEYNLVYKKEGYGTYIETGLINDGNGVVGVTPSLGKLSTADVLGFAYEQTEDTIYLHVYLNPPADASHIKYVRYFFYKDTTNFENFNYMSYFKYTPLIKVDKKEVLYKITKQEFIEMGFDPEEKVYLIAFGDSYYSNDYIDPLSGKKVFPNLKPTLAGALPVTLP